MTRHLWSNQLDEDVIRCWLCMANEAWSIQYPTCEEYKAYRDEGHARAFAELEKMRARRTT
jgi:hypothetical protein